MEGRFIDVHGLNIHYHDVGQGEATLLIHGGGPGAGGYSNFQRNIDVLAKRRRILAIDLPGYGRSDNQQCTAPLATMMAKVVVGFLDKLAIDRTNLVGNSLGGATSLLIALDHPERTNRLVLMGSGGSLPILSLAPSEGLARMLSFYDGEGPTLAKLRAIIDYLVFDNSSITDELLAERMKVALRSDVVSNPPLKMRLPGVQGASTEIWQRLGELKQDCLIIWGREDRVLPLDHCLLLLKLIAKARLHIFPRCGHWAQWEKADEFNALVSSFLDGK